MLGGVMKWRKSAVYDVLHKTSVSFLMAFSAVLAGYLGYNTVYWLTGMDSMSDYNMYHSYNNNNDRLTAFDPGQPG